jgi:hypothetical protein
MSPQDSRADCSVRCLPRNSGRYPPVGLHRRRSGPGLCTTGHGSPFRLPCPQIWDLQSPFQNDESTVPTLES